ncbi:MAG: Urease accessory protein ureE 1, partial [Betaproteobacteria bacterium]|nr:Urease accessory protein ureE 1 [Betaproteobacteria bacterium]
VLLLEEDRAIVVRLDEPQWLALAPRDAAAALELGYFCGNMHWKVRFVGEYLHVSMEGPREDYLTRLDHLLADGRVAEIR